MTRRLCASWTPTCPVSRPVSPPTLTDCWPITPRLASRLRVYLEVMNLAGRLAEDSHARPGVMPADSSTDAQIPPLGRGREACDESTPPPGASLLSTLDLGPGPPPQIQLHELLDESEPLVRPRSAEMPDQNGSGVGCYQLQGEIARGGMGAILKGRDVDLGRDLAIKVLLESHQGNSDVVRRFIEEAQIGGQLQHPGVVPVYELGTFPDRPALLRHEAGQGADLGEPAD